MKTNSTSSETGGPGVLRLRLRSETATHHQNLEDGLRLLAPGLTAERYGKILEGFLSIHTELEARLEAYAASNPSSLWAQIYLRDRRKLRWLKEDLGITDGSMSLTLRPFLIDWLENESELWGLLYVIEGSTLGGHVLAKKLKSFDLVPYGHRYFESYGSDVGRLWQQFGHELNTLPEEWHDAIVKSADRMFAELARHFKEVAP